MIRDFANKQTERIWSGLRSRELPPDIQDRARDKLRLLNRAKTARRPAQPAIKPLARPHGQPGWPAQHFH